MYKLFSSTSSLGNSIATTAREIDTGSPERRIVVLVLFLIGFACLVLKPRPMHRSNIAGWAAVYAILAVSSAFWSQDVMLTVRRCVILLAVLVFAAGVGAAYCGGKASGGRELVRTVCWTSFGVSLGVLTMQIYRGNVHLLEAGWRLGTPGRENQLAQIAAIGLIVAWLTRNSREIWPTRIGWLLPTAIPAFVLVMTKSRTTLVAAALALLLTEPLRKRVALKRALAFVVLASVLAALVSTSLFQTFWERGNSKALDTLSGRTEVWEAVWRQARLKPLLGYGYGAFWTPETINAIKRHWIATSAHNGYLDMFAELGLMGSLVMLGLVVVCARNSWKVMAFPHDREIGVSLLGLSVLFLILNADESFVQDIEFFPMSALLVFSFFVSRRVGMIESLTKMQRRLGHDMQPSHVFHRNAVPEL
jgi:O-antigen ligase